MTGAQRLIDEGKAAIARGDGRAAKSAFEALAAALAEPEMPWLLLARACRMADDPDAEEVALHKLLGRNSRDLTALLLMGDLKARLADDRAADSFYRTALNVAATSPEVPSPLHGLLAQARQFVASVQDRFAAHLVGRLDAANAGRPPRVGQALDLLLGKSQLYLQQPSSFYFPGLPQRQFYERDEFGWLANVEAAAPAMTAELEAILGEDREFAPYVQTPGDRPAPANPLRDDPSWGALYLWQGGERIAANATRAPLTMAALEHAPIPVIAKRSPMALYSLLKPGTHIQPHHGLLNTRLICHVPLIAPEGCELRVGSETRVWRIGETLIFDDSFEHEAWNRGASTRIVLLFEIWRPEIDEAERAALTALFEAINDYGGVAVDQG